MTQTRGTRGLFSLIVEPIRQLRFGVFAILLSVLFLLAAGWVFYTAFMEQYQQVMGLFNVVDENLQWELVTNDIFRKHAWRVAALFLVYLVTLCWILFKISHRVYGPLISVERFVDDLAQGKYNQRLKIRQKDDLQRLTEKLNALAASLDK
jgi:nitrate/nitrite-specific signal transduction histidine kinase